MCSVSVCTMPRSCRDLLRRSPVTGFIATSFSISKTTCLEPCHRDVPYPTQWTTNGPFLRDEYLLRSRVVVPNLDDPLSWYVEALHSRPESG